MRGVDPLGSYEANLAPGTSILLGTLAVLASSALLEVSRSLAEAFRGKWFAGNGRDLFHALAAAVLAAALFLSGMPPAMSCFWAAFALMGPLLLLDGLPARRTTRALCLLALIALVAAPALLDPRSVVNAMNTVARALF
jgi:hypothetical protein